MFRLVDQITGKTLLESDEKISVAIFVEDKERAFLMVSEQGITTYLRDRIKARPDIKTIRGRFGLENRMAL